MKLDELHAFPLNSQEEWKKAIQKELGERTLESLTWRPEEGIAMAPYYTESALGLTSDVGVDAFLIHQIMDQNTLEDSRKLALNCLAGGAQSLGLQYAQSMEDIDAVLKDIEWPFIQLHWNNYPLTTDSCNQLLEYTKLRGWSTNQLKGMIGVDAQQLWSSDWKPEDIRYVNQCFPCCRLFYINGIEVATSGATITQQIIAVLAQTQEALHRLTQMGFTIDEASAMIQINTTIDTSYFIEIAKLRVIRHLYAALVDAYRPQHNCSKSIWIHASIGQTAYAEMDTQTNLLRATTAAMSAALGNASSIEVMPYDGEVDRDYALRLSRNVLHMLREESKFDEARNAFKGSYYLEHLFAQLNDQAWNGFVTLEEEGGWTVQMENWLRSAQLEGQKRKSAIEAGNKIKVGVNKYQSNGHDKN